MPDREVSVAEDVVFLGDMGVHSLGVGSRGRRLHVADVQSVSLRERCAHACELLSRSERDSDAGDPELTEGSR